MKNKIFMKRISVLFLIVFSVAMLNSCTDNNNYNAAKTDTSGISQTDTLGENSEFNDESSTQSEDVDNWTKYY